MAVETHPRLKTQGVTGAEASKLEAVTSCADIENCLSDRLCILCRDGNLESVLTSVASTGNMEGFDVPGAKWDIEVGCEAEVERFEVKLTLCWGGVNVLLEYVFCKWALERNEALALNDLVIYFAITCFVELGDVGADVLNIFILASSIGNYIKSVRILERDD